VDQLAKDHPRTVEVKVEKGLLLEAKGSWNTSFAHWQALALLLNRMRSKPVEHYDAWYHAARALSKAGKTAEARQTLGSVMRLSPTVGGPEAKAKYQEFLAQLRWRFSSGACNAPIPYYRRRLVRFAHPPL
jgi:cellulose synthase operon protein C